MFSHSKEELKLGQRVWQSIFSDCLDLFLIFFLLKDNCFTEFVVFDHLDFIDAIGH